MNSDSFYVVAVNTNNKGSLNRLNGNDEAVIFVLRNQDSLQPLKAATSNPDSLSNFEERVCFAGDFVSQEEPHVLELLLRNGNWDAVEHHESIDSNGLDDSQPTGWGIREVDKSVARKQRHLHNLASVAPTVDLLN